MVKVIVFDFDGTLVDSNRVKKDLFFDVAEKYFPQSSSRMLDILDGNNGQMTRYEIFQELLLSNSDKEMHQDEFNFQLNMLIESYTEIAEKKVGSANEIKGATNTLKGLSRKYTLFINSATPNETLKNIIKYRNWSLYFKDIYGSENTKLENLSAIAESMNLKKSNIVMIGDSEDDYLSAQDFGCYFIGLNLQDLKDNYSIKSLSEIETIIGSI